MVRNVMFLIMHRYFTPPLRIAMVLLGVAVPISVALDNLLLAILLLTALFAARGIGRIAIENPVARAAWLLFGILLIGLSYGATPLREALGILGKYADLAFVPLLMWLLRDHAAQRWAQFSFLGAMGLTLLLSYLIGLQLLPLQHWMPTAAAVENPVIFHSHITQNNMMAFAAFLALLNLRTAASFGKRIAWGSFAVLAMVNVLLMVQGRTGYLILLVLLGWFIWSTLARLAAQRGKIWGWRQAGLIGFMALFAVTILAQLSPRLHNRMGLVVSEFQAWQPNQGKDTSTGQRLDFYYNTLQLVQQHPLVGMGTGGFQAAFAQQVSGTTALPTHNPHNEYLMITVQTGLVGLAFFLYLFFTLWRNAPKLDTPFAQDAARGLVLAYVVNCLFNSALLDHSDGLFFAFMTAVLFASLKSEPKIA